MAKIEKIIEKMKNQPKGITFAEMEKALRHIGYIEVRVKGSHHQYRNEEGLLTTVKRENPVNVEAVKFVLDRLGK